MRRPPSLTLRLTLLFSAIATVVLLSFGWIIERSLDKHFESEDIKELSMISQVVEQSLATLKPGGDFTRLKQRFDDLLVGHHGPRLHISNASGKLLYNSPGPDLSQVPLSSSPQSSGTDVQRWSDGEHNYRVQVRQIPGPGGPYTVITAVTIDFHLRFLNRFHHTLWLTVLGGIIAMGTMGWMAVRHGHRPLRNMVDQIGRISANELNTRLVPKAVPAELTELAASFNELLQRLEEAFNRLSNFSADIAHELRTPVTNLMTQTQVALSQVRSVEEYQEILYSSMEEYERMAQMIGDMLFLAKADNEQHPLHMETIDLESELHNLFDYYEAWAEGHQVSLNLEGQAQIRGDRLMLRRALSNLLSNAIRYTPAQESVTVRLRQDKESVNITVQNPGSPLPPEHLSRIFDRFYRPDPSRQRSGEGAGLGLAIVKTIVESHGGRIVATSDKKGTQLRITIPAQC